MQYLYACLFSNGHVKVGRSTDPISRIASHEERVSCLGIELVERHIFECAGPVVPAEASLIARCVAAAEKTHKNEWFSGLDFGDVVEWAELASKTVLSHPTNVNQHATQIIEALGGTTQVAKLCEIRAPSVSEWKEWGIPKARMMFLKLVHEKELAGIDCEAATAKPRGAK